jgi:hypothetical protein
VYELKSVLLESMSGDEEGLLLFVRGKLVAVLVRLSDIHEGLEGAWHVETTYNSAVVPNGATFSDLDEFERNLRMNLVDRR